jgi:hypothetical protein
MKEEKEEPKELTSNQMKVIIEQERQGRIEACSLAINTVLQEHKARLVSIVIIQERQISTRIDLVPLD